MLGFLTRLIGYGVLFGIVLRIAAMLWTQNGLDTVPAAADLHDAGVKALVAAPFVLAIAGWGTLRPLAVFAAWLLAGAVLTAPFALARALGAG